MSKYESDTAKAIKEQTAYFKSITDTIKIILVVGLITVIGLYGFIFIGSLVSNYLNHGHETIAPMPQPAWKQNNIMSENMSKKIDEYRLWCMNNHEIWSIQNDGNLPFCMNQYGEKIHP